MRFRLRPAEPILITSAAEPRDDEIRRRELRYLLWMGIRVVLFVLAVVALSGWVRYLAVLGALIIPWVAVVVANGGPPRSHRQRAGYVPRSGSGQPPLAALEARAHVIVDADDVMSDDVMSDDVRSDDVMSDDVRSDDPRTGAGRGDDLQTRSRAADLRDDGVPTGPGAQPGRADRTGPSAPDVGFFGPRRPPREARRGR